MFSPSTCPECYSLQTSGVTCQEHFHTLLYWESEIPAYGDIHHLTVLCYHLQHPSLYSPEGLQSAQKLLVDFLVYGLSPAQARRQNKDIVDSGNRQIRITSRPGLRGSYSVPVHWTMTVADVVAAGKENYLTSVRAWAGSILRALQELPPYPVT